MRLDSPRISIHVVQVWIVSRSGILVLLLIVLLFALLCALITLLFFFLHCGCASEVSLLLLYELVIYPSECDY